MEAATRIVTKQDILNTFKNAKRGRPTVLEQRDLVSAIQTGYSWRQAVNNKYVAIGFWAVSDYLDETKATEIFITTDKRRIRYQGVLEQIGRVLYEVDRKDKTVFDVEDVVDMIKIALTEIEKGVPSKEIESKLRGARLIVKQTRLE